MSAQWVSRKAFASDDFEVAVLNPLPKVHSSGL